jgi:hypothetical protein
MVLNSYICIRKFISEYFNRKICYVVVLLKAAVYCYQI